MALPTSRDTTYVPGYPPFISSAEINDFQDQIISLSKVRAGGDFSLTDDFTGSAIDAGIWGTVTNVSLLSADVDALGVAQLDPTGGGGSSKLITQQMNVGLRDFKLSFNARFSGYTNASIGSVYLGIYDAGTTNNCCYFLITRTALLTGNVNLAYDNNNQGFLTQLPTSVAVNIASYAFFQIIRVGTSLTFLINGTTVNSTTAYMQNITGTAVFGVQSLSPNAAGVCQVDLAKCLIKRPY